MGLVIFLLLITHLNFVKHNSFSAGQLLMMREVEKRTGKPAAFVETDLVIRDISPPPMSRTVWKVISR